MKKGAFKGKVNDQGVELVPDWGSKGIHLITGFPCKRYRDYVNGDRNILEERERRSKYMKEYYQKKKNNSKSKS